MKKLNGNGIENINLDQDYEDFKQKCIKYGKILFDGYTNPDNPLYNEAMMRSQDKIVRFCDAVSMQLAEEFMDDDYYKDLSFDERSKKEFDRIDYYKDLFANVVDLRNNNNGLNSPNQQIGTNNSKINQQQFIKNNNPAIGLLNGYINNNEGADNMNYQQNNQSYGYQSNPYQQEQQQYQQALYEEQLRQQQYQQYIYQQQQMQQQQALYEEQLRQQQYQQYIYQQQQNYYQPQYQYTTPYSCEYDYTNYEQYYQPQTEDKVLFSLTIDNAGNMSDDFVYELYEKEDTHPEPIQVKIEEKQKRKITRSEEKASKYIGKKIKKWLSDKFDPHYDNLSFPVIKYMDEIKYTVEELIEKGIIYGLDVVMW